MEVRSDKEKVMVVISVPVLLLESRVVISSPVESGHSNWTLTQTGGRNCRCLPLGTDSGQGAEAPCSKVLGWPDCSPAEGEDAEATEVCFAWEAQSECGGSGPRELACGSSG